MKHAIFYLRLLFSLSILLKIILFTGCTSRRISDNETEASVFLEQVFSDTSDYYYTDFRILDQRISTSTPIGVFDSGTGGLTVLDAILNFDNYDLSNNKYKLTGDGVKDFSNESFIYFGDQAYMPYGNYSAMNKTSFLKELVLKDAHFLLVQIGR